jgi:hypothetical protein
MVFVDTDPDIQLTIIDNLSAWTSNSPTKATLPSPQNIIGWYPFLLSESSTTTLSTQTIPTPYRSQSASAFFPAPFDLS